MKTPGNSVIAKLLAILTALAVIATTGAAASAAPNEPAYTLHKVQEIWSKGFTGQGMTVAVIDQGVNLTHEYFAGQIVDGICVYQPQSPNLCPNGTKYQTGIQAASQRFEKGVIVASENHGNMVSGLIAGKPNDQAPGGIAPNAKLVMANTDLNLASVVSALNYFYDNRLKYNIVAVSMSFGIGGGSSREFILDCNKNPDYAQLKATLAKLRAVGIMPFAASGNGFILNEVGLNAPTCLSEVVSIGAVDAKSQVSIYTTMNAKVELLGSDFAKTANTNGYQTAGGTSAAAPVVAASYTLLRQAFPSQSPEVVLEAMKGSGRKIDDIVRKEIPLVDLTAAYALLSGTPNTSSPVVVTPPAAVDPVISVTTTKGLLVINVKGFQGKKLTAKLGNTWISMPALINSAGLSYTKITRKYASGSKVSYDIFIDGVKKSSGIRTIR